ncbi:PREDICTED: uncharacterized protein LOC18595892 isoform X4 [Theobroma cacao]|uniref:Uncharacterized protein LOC18595892 isoform X4 n=1 Tax=Theobroma cacao TaxID=3641 RepID=A0AB32WJ38_THECC|nr:PREDICTED: uncharacterized protein LOC18595892 isoform X4 [Theobroma cacao]
MDGNVMADPDSESYFQSDTLGLRHISSSLFNIPGFLVGFSTKGSSDSDMVRSPTSPLDLRVFANFSNPFSGRSPRSSSQSGYQKKWDCSKMGLGIVNLLADEIKSDGEDLDSPKRKNIIFGPQVKTKFPSSSRGEKAFCSFDCRSEEIFAEEMEKTCNNSFNGSPEQSDDEDLFLMAMDDRSINHESWIAKHRV